MHCFVLWGCAWVRLVPHLELWGACIYAGPALFCEGGQQALNKRSTNAQQTLNKRSTNSQQTLNKRPTNSQQTLNKQRSTNAQQTLNKRPKNAQQTTLNKRSTTLNKRLTNAQQTLNKCSTNAQQTTLNKRSTHARQTFNNRSTSAHKCTSAYAECECEMSAKSALFCSLGDVPGFDWYHTWNCFVRAYLLVRHFFVKGVKKWAQIGV